MDEFEGLQETWEAFKFARKRARKRVEEEFQEAMQARVDEIIRGDREELRDRVQAVLQGGSAIPIRDNLGLHSKSWIDFQEEAGVPKSPPGRPAQPLVHGRYSSYTRGCRCDECRAAVREYQRERARKVQMKGEQNGD